MLPDEEITAETLFLVDDLDRPSSVRNNLNKVEKKIAAPALGVLEQLSEIVTLSPELTDRLLQIASNVGAATLNSELDTEAQLSTNPTTGLF